MINLIFELKDLKEAIKYLEDGGGTIVYVQLEGRGGSFVELNEYSMTFGQTINRGLGIYCHEKRK